MSNKGFWLNFTKGLKMAFIQRSVKLWVIYMFWCMFVLTLYIPILKIIGNYSTFGWVVGEILYVILVFEIIEATDKELGYE